MASRAARRARANERKAAKAARLEGRAMAHKRQSNLAIAAGNRPPSPAELLELRAWRSVTDSTMHVANAAAYSVRECSNRPRLDGLTDGMRATFSRRMAEKYAKA